jgi:hypothetical protein
MVLCGQVRAAGLAGSDGAFTKGAEVIGATTALNGVFMRLVLQLRQLPHSAASARTDNENKRCLESCRPQAGCCARRVIACCSRAAHAHVLLVHAVVLPPRQVAAVADETVEVRRANHVVEQDGPCSKLLRFYTATLRQQRTCSATERLDLPAGGRTQAAADDSSLAV